MSNVAKLPAAVAADEREKQWQETAAKVKASLAETEKRWGVKTPALFPADGLDFRLLYVTADADMPDDCLAKGLCILASLKEGAGYVVSLPGLYLAVVSADGNTLKGLVHGEDFNDYWADS